MRPWIFQKFLTVLLKIFLFKIHAHLVFSTKTDALIKNFVKKKRVQKVILMDFFWVDRSQKRDAATNSTGSVVVQSNYCGISKLYL